MKKLTIIISLFGIIGIAVAQLPYPEITFTNITQTDALVTWTEVQGANGYTITWCESFVYPPLLEPFDVGTDTFFEIYNLQANYCYKVFVMPYNEEGMNDLGTGEVFCAIPYPAIASFFADDCTIKIDSYVTFTNSSIWADEYVWEFDGGVPNVTSQANPIVLYKEPGIYNVTLTAYNEIGYDKVTASGYIIVSQ